jgi:hypothetical protein
VTYEDDWEGNDCDDNDDTGAGMRGPKAYVYKDDNADDKESFTNEKLHRNIGVKFPLLKMMHQVRKLCLYCLAAHLVFVNLWAHNSMGLSTVSKFEFLL